MLYALSLLGFIVAVVLLKKWNEKMAASAAQHPDVQALSRMMLEQTGFVHAKDPGAPFDEQLAYSLRQAKAYGSVHLLRRRDGFEFHFEQDSKPTATGYSISARWWTPMRARFGIHIAAKSIAGGFLERSKTPGFERKFSPAYSDEVVVQDPQLAAQVKVWATDAEGAAWLLAQPGIKEALLSVRALDLLISEDRMAFADPLMENLTPVNGAMAMVGMAPAAQAQTLAAGHDTISRLFAAVGPVMSA